MNYRNVAILLIFTVSLALLNCGGGSSSGGSDNRVDVSGRWSGAVTKVTDSCAGSNAAQTINFSHSVVQNGDAIVLNSNAIQYVGNLVGGTGFSVDAALGAQTIGSQQCTTTGRIEYENVDADNDATANVDIRALRNCEDGTTCELAYTGTGTRSVSGISPTAVPTTGVGSTPSPITTPSIGATPVPVSMTTPIAGGCPAIIERTASGTYGGDGGCGISDVLYRVNTATTPNVVVLSPFGANGATSFTVSTDNTSAAASVRTDLTILGEVGYSCSLACSAPGTFTVACFKEGGTQCTEKF